MKKWLKRLIDYLFGEYLFELKSIRHELRVLNSKIDYGSSFTIPIGDPKTDGSYIGVSSLEPIEPIKGIKIFRSE